MRISAAVAEVLLPILNDMKTDLNNLNELYSNLNETVSNLEETVSNLEETVSDLNKTVEDHKSQTTSELDDLHSSIDNPPTNVIADAVLVKLLPYLNNVEENLCEKIDESVNSLSGDISDLNERLTDLEVNVCNLSDSVINLDETMKETIEEYKNQTTYEVTELHTSLQTYIDNPPTDVIAIALLGILLPYLNNLDEKIDKSTNSLTGDLSSLSGSITDLREKVCNVSDSQIEIAQDMNETINTHMEHLNMKLMSIKSSMRQQHRDIGDELEQHKNHVNSELIELENNQDDIDTKLDSLDTKQDELSMQVMSVSSELEQSILNNVTEELKKTSDGLHQSLGYTCGGEGGWRRVVYFDMTDLNADCPTGWQLTSYSKRTCGRVTTGIDSPVTQSSSLSLEEPTIECVELSEHIRMVQQMHLRPMIMETLLLLMVPMLVVLVSHMVVHDNTSGHLQLVLVKIYQLGMMTALVMLLHGITIDIPPFVGGDYFCESGRNSTYRPPSFAEADPLWDGEGCASTSTCCEMNNPPYFTKQLTNPTTDDIEIEARLCRWDSTDDSPVEFIELYVK